MDLIVGTAGHIDHGKTSLVRALTGVDADRLPDEKRRGITIDLGFAETELGGLSIGFVDVPGHERFIKNMLAGIGGIGHLLLVVAAAEGVMPQTREHFDICRLLDIREGTIVLTKCDLVDDETRQIAEMEVHDLAAGTFLEGAPVIGVSSVTGFGIDVLKQRLTEVAARYRKEPDGKVTRLPIDRSFTVKGFGTVVTGTLVSGSIAREDEMELLPQGVRVRVRGVEVHGRKAERASFGHRTAVNLAGVQQSEASRGMTLAEPGVLRPTQIVNCEAEVLMSSPLMLRSRQRVRVHIGTAEVLARVNVLDAAGEIAAGGKGFVQLRFESPIVCVPGERFVIRRYSPPATIGGGSVIENDAERLRQKLAPSTRERLSAIASAADRNTALIEAAVNSAGRKGVTFGGLAARTAAVNSVLYAAIDGTIASGNAVKAGGRLVAAAVYQGLKKEAAAAVENFQKREPLDKGMPVEALREQAFRGVVEAVSDAVLRELEADGTVRVTAGFAAAGSGGMQLPTADKVLLDKILDIYTVSRLSVPRLDELIADIGVSKDKCLKLLTLLVDRGELIRAAAEFYFSKAEIDALISKLRAPGRGQFDVAEFKAAAGVSRKYAIPLLEYLDHERITVRVGDKRQLIG
ncbi:MAG: selenocysteine-specific translation elongation factor [Acidobacteria bacterium]|nr:selenocysteine-specific translation elongation factor [Acidobacteriota bacterium]